MTPYTGYGYGEWYMWTDGGLDYDRYNYDNSYGRKDRRTRVGTIMPILSLRPVTSTSTTTTMSRFPTGV